MYKAYPGDTRYLVSDNGVVIGPRGWHLKPAPVTGGYLTVNVAGKTRKVAHLVAESFIGPRPVGLEVAHLDGDNTNNAVENLAYVTKAENEAHKIAHGTSNHGEGNGRAKLTEKEVVRLREMIFAGYTQKFIAQVFSITQGHVSSIKRGVSW